MPEVVVVVVVVVVDDDDSSSSNGETSDAVRWYMLSSEEGLCQ